MGIDMRTVGGARSVAPMPGSSKSSVASANGVPAEPSVKDTSGVSVNLTEAASLLQVHEASGENHAFDPARVEALKEAIASGRYHVDASRVAAKFMSLEPDL